jgi:hypothetical protein
VPFFNVWEVPGDNPVLRFLRLSDGARLEPTGFVASLGEAILTRNGEGELWLEAKSGDRRMVAGKDCLAKVLHTDAARELVVYGCSKLYGGRRELYLRNADSRKALNLFVAPFETDGALPHSPELLPIYPGNEVFLLHVQRAELAQLTQGSHVVASHGVNALLTRDDKLWFLSLSYRERKPLITETPLNLKRPALSAVLQNGRWVSFGTSLFDLKTPMLVGSFAQPPLALSSSGHGLVPHAAQRQSLLRGPLSWQRAAR